MLNVIMYYVSISSSSQSLLTSLSMQFGIFVPAEICGAVLLAAVPEIKFSKVRGAFSNPVTQCKGPTEVSQSVPAPEWCKIHQRIQVLVCTMLLGPLQFCRPAC